MNRRPSSYFFFAIVALCAACSARSSLIDGYEVGGAGGGTSVNHAATTNVVGSTGSGGAAMCNPPPAPTPTAPTDPGCYADLMNMGWLAVPCVCDLWLANTLPDQVMASIDLSVTPPDQAPMLTGMFDDEIVFDDPEGTFYATWTKQSGNGTAFTITNENGSTTVRMGEADVHLSPAPIPACTTSKATAHILGGNYMARLAMHATLLNHGMVFSTVDNFCSNPPPT